MSHVSAVALIAAPAKVSAASVRKMIGAQNATHAEALDSIATATGTVFFVPPSALTIENGYNVRTFDASNKDDETLMRSIAAEGVSTPLTVRREGETIFVVAGHRRLGAVRAILAKGDNKRLASVPVILTSARLSSVDRLYDLMESNSGKPLTMLESGVVCARLIEAGQDRKAMARRLGVTARQIGNMLYLAHAPADIRAALEAGRIAGTMVYEYAQTVTRKGGTAEDAYTHILGALGVVKAPGKVTLKDVLAFAATVAPAGDDAEGDDDGQGDGEGQGSTSGNAKTVKLNLADLGTVLACLAVVAKPGPAPDAAMVAKAAELLARLMPST